MAGEMRETTSAPSMSVAIATRDRPEHLGRALDGLLNVDGHFDEMIIVDDSRKDRTKRVVSNREPAFGRRGVDVRYQRRRRTGLPSARNTAVDLTNTEVVCFLDDDTVCTAGWLDAIREGYSRYGATAVGGPAIPVDSDRSPVASRIETDRNMNRITAYGEVLLSSDRWVPPRPIRTEVLRGANMSFRTDAIVEAGGFDTGYRGNAFLEEVDLITRLRNRGEEVLYHPRALVYHFNTPSDTIRSEKAKREDNYWTGRNVIRYRKKNFQETFFISMVRLLLYTPYPPGPVWKQIGAAALERDITKLWYLKGYLKGLREVTE